MTGSERKEWFERKFLEAMRALHDANHALMWVGMHNHRHYQTLLDAVMRHGVETLGIIEREESQT